MEQVYQEVHGKLALALGSGVKTVMAAFYVVVGSYRLHVDGPTGWRPGVAFYPKKISTSVAKSEILQT